MEKSFLIIRDLGDTGDAFDDDDDSVSGESHATFDVSILRALKHVTRRCGTGHEMAVVEKALDDDELFESERQTLRTLEIEHTVEIGKLMRGLPA